MRWLDASPTWWTWVWASSGRWWCIGKPGVLQSMGSQRVGHDWGTEQNWIYTKEYHLVSSVAQSYLSPVYHQLLELVQTHVHRVGNAMKEHHLVLKRKKILTHGFTWMNLEDIVLSKTSQSPSCDKYHMIPLIWGFSTRQMHMQAYLDYHASLYCNSCFIVVIWNRMSRSSPVYLLERSGMWLPWAWEVGDGELLLKGHRDSVLQDGKVLKVSFTTVWIYLTLLNSPLWNG